MTDSPKHTEAGKDYFGFLCKNPECGLPIVMGEIPLSGLDAQGGVEIASRHATHAIICQRCKTEAVYQTKELQRFHSVNKGQLS